jgi:replicative DNA helicase
MHYLTKKVNDLPEEQKLTVVSEILTTVTAAPETTVDKIQLVSMLDYTEEAQEYAKNYGKMQGISTGYDELDELTKGLVKGELIVIAGKTSYGKTTLAVNIANRVALANYRVLFVTLEMTRTQLTSKFVYINGSATSEDYLQVAANTVFQKNDELNWKDIDALIANARLQAGVNLVVIDHLHHFTRELEHVVEDLGRITKELQKNAQRHDLPIVLISHVRKIFNGAEATIEDLRSSSYIAQDADIVLMVGRKKEEPDRIKVRIEKNRNRGYDYNNNECDLIFDNTRIYGKQDKWWGESVA